MFIKIIGAICFFLVIVLIDLPHLRKASNKRKTMIIYSSFFIINLAISILLLSGMQIISPAEIVEHIVKFIVPIKPVR